MTTGISRLKFITITETYLGRCLEQQNSHLVLIMLDSLSLMLYFCYHDKVCYDLSPSPKTDHYYLLDSVKIRQWIQYIKTLEIACEFPVTFNISLKTYLISHWVKGCFLGSYSNNGMRTPLPRAPVNFPYMESSTESRFSTYTVSTLGYWMSMECKLVILLWFV